MKREKIKYEVKEVYDKLSILFFSNLFLLFYILLIIYQNRFEYAKFLIVPLFILFFCGYGYLLGEFVENYIRRTFNFFKENLSYRKYRYIYWILFSMILIIILIIIGYYSLGKEKIVEICITTGLMGVLTILGFVLKRKYESK